jgi:all-trans-retinol 13,14-reductase
MVVPKYDTLVIGGGISGLACALLRARKGERVALIEKSEHLSPTLHGFVRGGAHMDSGFHYAGSMMPDGLLPHLLAEMGISDGLNGTVCAPETVDRVRFAQPSFEFCFPQGWEAVEQGLCRVSPADSHRVKDFLAKVRGLWQQARTAFVRDRGRSLDVLFTAAGHSLQAEIARCTDNALLRGLLGCHGILYGSLAKETSVLFHSQIVGSYYESACLVKGGGRVWVETFEKALRDARVDVMCGTKVSRIHVDEHRHFAEAELDTGVRLPAVKCISTIHPKLMLEMMPPHTLTPAYRRRIQDLEETPSAVVLYGRCPSAGFAGNLILADRPGAIEQWPHMPLAERPLFVSIPVDSRANGISVICPAVLADMPGSEVDSKRPEGYKEWKDGIARRLMQRLQNIAGDLIGTFELLDMATPLTFRDWLSSPDGGLYGIKHRLTDLPLLPRTAVKGFYLSGQAIVAPGVLGTLCASFLTDNCIV